MPSPSAGPDPLRTGRDPRHQCRPQRVEPRGRKPASLGFAEAAAPPLTALTGLEVIGTASRAETRQYVPDRGAHRVIDHHGDLVAPPWG